MHASNQMTPSLVKTSKRKLIFRYRLATWRNRPLPDFIIVGAQRSGTTSLYAYLKQHPQLWPSYRKEVHFFDGGLNPIIDNFEKGQAWYRAHFPINISTSVHSKTFEASPSYLFSPLTPKRIFALVPEVKLIILLRNPTERAISHYFHTKRTGFESLLIYDALQAEEKRLESVVEKKDYKNDIFLRNSYKSRGLYREQIERFLNYFSWQQILVLNSEEFFSEPDNTLRQIFEFVGIDAGFKVRDLQPRNVANNKDEVDSTVYRYLNSYYFPHNQALYELVGKDYEW